MFVENAEPVKENDDVRERADGTPAISLMAAKALLLIASLSHGQRWLVRTTELT